MIFLTKKVTFNKIGQICSVRPRRKEQNADFLKKVIIIIDTSD